jgi:predicted enzyme related to lactoylglutathione lyase
MPGPPFWLYYVYVKDLDKAAESVKQHGGQVLNGPMEVPGGDRIAQCMDPQGAAFAIHGK